MHKCNLCPRRCGADRENKIVGYCGQTNDITAARASLHFWEEPCISGTCGSGTVFFSGCSLKCIYCQNREIALGKHKKTITKERLGEIFLELQNRGAHNINLVTPTHFVPQITEALNIAKNRGLSIPIVYNTSGYELVETLKMLDSVVDIYLADFKYMNSNTADKYSNAPDYPDVAKAALSEMYRQIPKCKFDSENIMTKGIIVRNLLLPGSLKNSEDVIEYVYKTYGDDVFISIMNQYTPIVEIEQYPELNSRVPKREYEKLVNYALNIGIKNAFIQEEKTADDSFIPAFDFEGL